MVETHSAHHVKRHTKGHVQGQAGLVKGQAGRVFANVFPCCCEDVFWAAIEMPQVSHKVCSVGLFGPVLCSSNLDGQQ